MELPKGKSVALCSEEVEYNISGLFLCIDLLFKLLTMVEEKFEYRMPIKYIYGAPKVRWNGGRFILKSSCDNFTIKDIENEVKQVISHEITPLFTFSNTLLELEYLKDNKCNQILELINEYRAQVIVASELLRYYIQEKYPNIEIHASVIKTAFEEKRDVDYYDLILTGDLGKYGKEILKDYMREEYKIDLSKNYNDCGVILYDTDKQKQVQAGGSGPVCSALVNFTMIMDKLKKKELKRVLLVATGALFSPTFVYQKENILSIAHAISLEAVE